MDEETAVKFLSGESEKLVIHAGGALIVEMDAPYWLTEIDMDAIGRTAVAISGETENTRIKDLAYLEKGSRVFLRPPVLCKYLLISPAPGNEGDICLRGLRAKGIPTLGAQILYEDAENRIVLDANDASNPLSVLRIPIRQSHYRLAERLLEGEGTLDAHQKIMVFMDYISDFYTGVASRYYMDIGMKTYLGACGLYSDLLVALARTQGIPARLLTLANYPNGDGHAVCEVFFDDCWHLYDPTFGAYYTATLGDSTYSKVLGFSELTQGVGTSVTCIVTSPHRLIGKRSYEFLGSHIYEAANPKGVFGTAHPMIYPLHIHLEDNHSLLTQAGFTAKYQGIQYIGAAETNNEHEWILSGLEPGKSYDFIATATGIDGEMLDKPFIARAVSANAEIVTGGEHRFKHSDENSVQWRISFIPESETAHIHLTHDYRGPEFHYVSFSSFELRQADANGE